MELFPFTDSYPIALNLRGSKCTLYSETTMNLAILLQVLAVLIAFTACSAGSKKERHSHNGILKPYSGKHIPYTISVNENAALDEGKPVRTMWSTFTMSTGHLSSHLEQVIINERSGKDGRGVVIQDVHAVPEICMDRIRDLAHYHKMVKNGTTSSSTCYWAISLIKPYIVSSLVKKVTPYDTVKFENVRFPSTCIRPFDD